MLLGLSLFIFIEHHQFVMYLLSCYGLFITSMITVDRIGRHEVLLPINHKNYNFRGKKNSQVMQERANLH